MDNINVYTENTTWSAMDVLNSAAVKEVLLLDDYHLWSGWDLTLIGAEVSLRLAANTSTTCEQLLAAGSASLGLLVQANWTGPDQDSFCIGALTTKTNGHLDRCLGSLSVDGSAVYSLLRHPEALAVARVIFEECQACLSALPGFVLWRIRYCWLYQQLLEEPSPKLFSMFQQDVTLLAESNELLSGSKQLMVEHCLTVAHVYNHYHHVTEASKYIEKAQRALKLSLQLTGAMGKRTRFQEPRAQLALRLTTDPDSAHPESGKESSREDASPSTQRKLTARTDESDEAAAEGTGPDSGSDCLLEAGAADRPDRELASDGDSPATTVSADEREPAACCVLPPDLRLGDETRLERVQYDDASLTEVAPTPLQQALVLAKFFQELRAQGRSEIRDEQLMVLLTVVTQTPSIWALQLSALLQRSRLEAGQRRTAERAMMQTQALVDAVAAKEPPPQQRLSLFFCSRVPARWQLEAELAERYMAMGLVKAALEVYERLQLWEQAIECYHLLQQRQRAAETIRAQISVHGETPKLLCLLGDATDDVDLYRRAWEMSEHKFVRAVRSEGFYYYYRKQYERCVPLLRRAVELNSLQFDVWTRLAYAALQTQDWSTCAAAYRRCCHLEPDNYESWNNIARAYTQLGQKERAWSCLQEAARLCFDNWHIWENLLLVSLEVGEFDEAVHSYSRLADVKERHADPQLLAVLVSAVVRDLPDRRGLPAGRLRRPLTALLAKLTSQTTTDAALWSLYGDLSAGAAERSDEHCFRTVQHYQRALRCLAQKPGGERDAATAQRMLAAATKVAQAVVAWSAVAESGPRISQTLSSVKLSVRGVLTRVRAAHGTPLPDGLSTPASEADAALQQLLDALAGQGQTAPAAS